MMELKSCSALWMATRGSMNLTKPNTYIAFPCFENAVPELPVRKTKENTMIKGISLKI